MAQKVGRQLLLHTLLFLSNPFLNEDPSDKVKMVSCSPQVLESLTSSVNHYTLHTPTTFLLLAPRSRVN